MKVIVKNIDHREMTVVVPVTAHQECDIRLEAYDYDNQKTYFLTREKKFKGTCNFKIKLPVSPKRMAINIYNASVGNKELGQDKSFTVGKVYSEKLTRNLGRVSWGKYNLKDFVDLATRFSYNLSYLEANKTYVSDSGKFSIELLPTIRDASGKELNTPARINKTTGKIQISKVAFDGYTVPERMAILLHEYSHYNINSNPDDESEADLNGLTVYLALGFPTVEAYDAFANVFMGAPTEENRKRYEIIDSFIRDFEKKNIVLH